MIPLEKPDPSASWRTRARDGMEAAFAALAMAATLATVTVAGGARLLREPRLPGGLACGIGGMALMLAGFLLRRAAVAGGNGAP